MDTNSQSKVLHGGRAGGMPNYRNDILIEIIEEHLPQGLEAWRKVDMAYQNASNEVNLW